MADGPMVPFSTQSEPGDPDHPWTLRELMVACRKRTPKILRELDRIVDDPDVPTSYKLVASEMLLSRGYGKARQVLGSEANSALSAPGAAVRIYIPDNGRDRHDDILPASLIDQSGNE